MTYELKCKCGNTELRDYKPNLKIENCSNCGKNFFIWVELE